MEVPHGWVPVNTHRKLVLTSVRRLWVARYTKTTEDRDTTTDEPDTLHKTYESRAERPNIAVEEDTEEIRKWRGLSQSETDLCWKKLAERMEEEVLDKYKVEESKRLALKAEVVLEWRRVRKNKRCKVRKRLEDCWAKDFSLFNKYNLQRQQSKQDELTEEGEMRQQQRMAFMKDLIKKIRSKGRMDAKNRWWVSELLAKGLAKPTMWGEEYRSWRKRRKTRDCWTVVNKKNRMVKTLSMQ